MAYEVIDELKKIAKKYNITTTAVSLSWLLSKKVVATIILGVSKIEQLNDNLSCGEIVLDEKDIKRIDELTKPEIRYPKTFIAFQDQILLRQNGKTVETTAILVLCAIVKRLHVYFKIKTAMLEVFAIAVFIKYDID